jgi:hypothetical protein
VYRFDATLWLHDGDAGWHFITVPDDVSDDIEARAASSRRGFGSVRVRVTVGSSTWATSVFPDGKRRAYVLPVKQAIRKAERIVPGDEVGVALELVDVDGALART